MILMNDNYPAGAANDPNAPYNGPLENEKSFNFELSIKGSITILHYSEEELEEKLKRSRKILENVEDYIPNLGWDYDVDFRVEKSFSEIW